MSGNVVATPFTMSSSCSMFSGALLRRSMECKIYADEEGLIVDTCSIVYPYLS
jgi:hypothetical protein